MNKKIATLSIAGTLVFGASGVAVVDRQIDPYIDKNTHYELSIKSDIPQGERVEISKDRAELTLVGWNDEYNIKIIPQVPEAPVFGATERVRKDFEVQADRPLLSKRMEYKSGDVTAFIEPKEGTENEFDIDFTLDSKPDTNVFEYKIEGAEEFDFFYQPGLTEKEKSLGYIQADNIPGSLAIYSKTHRDYIQGETNYATGKIAHIYRPKAIDADGNEVWAELKYEDGLLSVIVPQDFLDNAVYPVVVDPTLGYTTIGNTGVLTNADLISQSTVTAVASTKVVAIIAAISDNSGVPGTVSVKGTLVASSTLNLLTNGVTGAEVSGVSKTWHGLTFSTNPDFVSGTKYLAGVIFNSSSAILWSDTVGSPYYYSEDSSNSYTTPADEGALTTQTAGKAISVYVVYQTGFQAVTTPGSTSGTTMTFNGVANLYDQAGVDSFFTYGTTSNAHNATTTFVYKNATTTFSDIATGEIVTKYYFRAGLQASSSAYSFGEEAVFITGTTTSTYVGTTTSDIGFCYQSGTARCFTGASNPGSNARMGFRTGVNFGNITTGFRFNNINIPQGTTVTSAYFYYTAFDTDATSPPTVKISAEAADSALTFSTTGADSPDTTAFGGSRATTTASVSWTMANQTVDVVYKSPDIKTVVQEVLDRAGWVSGNSLVIFLGPEDFVDNFNAKNSLSSAYLVINYSTASGTFQDIIWFNED